MLKNCWIFDLETYLNIFTCCAVHSNGKHMRVYEISDRKDESEEMMEWLRNLVRHNHKMVGFNNLGFDYPIIHYMIEKSRRYKSMGKQCKFTPLELYTQAQNMIRSQDNSFGSAIRPSDVVIPQIDLYKIHHFDNKAKATSLKMLEFNMRSQNIEDLPYKIGSSLNDEEKDVLIEYNKHDVLQTLEFMKHSMDAITFREGLTKKYGFDCTNFNDTKIGKEYFINRLEKDIPGSCYKRVGGRRVINQTKRDVIHLKDVIFDYIKFNRPEFNALLNWFKDQSITETKGVFTDILESDAREVAKYANMRKKRQKFKGKPSQEMIDSIKGDKPLMWVEEILLKSKKESFSYWWNWNVLDTLNVVIDGFQFDYGVGGIHGSVDSQSLYSDDEYVIIDCDVASMYPNIAIANKVYPEHLSPKFCDIYEDVYEERKSHPKDTAENAVMKLALNGTYGETNNQYSPFYDPQFTMAITINGQLSLSMLSEMLLELEGCQMIQCNTDGVTVRIPRSMEKEYYEKCVAWEKITRLQLEYAIYDQMHVRDVNNYLAVSGGKVKRKGSYEYANLGWHQNQSALVVPMAAEHELLGRGTVEEFISSHDDKFDFFLRTKVPRSSRLVLVYEEIDGETREEEQQNICRYYACKDGGKLVKIMPPLKGKEEGGERRLGIDTQWNVKTCNNVLDFQDDINYDYYIESARKLVDCFKQQGDTKTNDTKEK